MCYWEEKISRHSFDGLYDLSSTGFLVITPLITYLIWHMVLGHVHVNQEGSLYCMVWISSFCTLNFSQSLKSWKEILLYTKNLLEITMNKGSTHHWIFQTLNSFIIHVTAHLSFAKLHFLSYCSQFQIATNSVTCQLW